MRINLFFETIADSKINEKVKGIDIIRLRTTVEFKRIDGIYFSYKKKMAFLE